MNQNEAAPERSSAGRHSIFGTAFTDEFDHDRWRSQHDVVRDILFSAAECGAWLTLAELAALTRFPEPSIAAQIRALRTPRRGEYIVAKRRRLQAGIDSSVLSGMRSDREFPGDGAWEYQVDLRSKPIRA
jgi:hypothetical protein